MPTPSSRLRAARFGLPCLFAALCAVGATIALPIPGSPVPIVVQNLFVVLAGLLLGPVEGGLAVLLFLVLGALGFPFFSGGRGGLAVLLGPTGGYLVGYLVAAVIAGLLARRRKLLWTVLAAVLGFAAILAMGSLGLRLLRNVDWTKALAVGVLPFLIGDGIKCAIAVLVAHKLGPFVDSLVGRPPRA